MSEQESGMPGEIGFMVTLKDVYDLVGDVKRTVDPIPDRVRMLEKKVEDFENRMRSLERQAWVWVGIAAAAGGGLSALIGR